MGLLSSYTDNKKRKKLIKEYETIKELHDKSAALDVTDATQREIITAQQGILLNNFRALARLYATLIPKLHADKKESFATFQGCPSRVCFDNKTPSIVHAIINPLDLSLEYKFLTLNNARIKTVVLNKLHTRAKTKLSNKIKTYCTKFGDKAIITYEFIFKKPSLASISERLKFIATYLTDNDIELAYKHIIHIPLEYRKEISNTELVEFITAMQLDKYDYVIQGRI